MLVCYWVVSGSLMDSQWGPDQLIVPMPAPSQRSSNASSTAPSLKTAMAVKSAVKSFASTAAAAKANANSLSNHGSYANASTQQHGTGNKVGPKKDAANTKKASEEKMPLEKPPAPAAAYDMPRDIVEEMPRLPSSTTSIMSLTKDAPGPPRSSASSIGRPVHRSEYLKVHIVHLRSHSIKPQYNEYFQFLLCSFLKLCT